MRLRAAWKDVHETLSVLNVDVRLPTYPLRYDCTSCRAIRMFVPVNDCSDQNPEHQEPEMSAQDKELVDGLLGIHGVISVRMSDYRVSIDIGGVFGWEEIQPRAESVVADWAGVDPPLPKKLTFRQRVFRLFKR